MDCKRLSVRLVGHPSRRAATKPWQAETDGAEEKITYVTEEEDIDWMEYAPIDKFASQTALYLGQGDEVPAPPLEDERQRRALQTS